MVEMSLLTFVEFTTLYSLSEPIFGDRKPFERLYSRRKTVFFFSLRAIDEWNEPKFTRKYIRESLFVWLLLFFCVKSIRKQSESFEWLFRGGNGLSVYVRSFASIVKLELESTVEKLFILQCSLTYRFVVYPIHTVSCRIFVPFALCVAASFVRFIW